MIYLEISYLKSSIITLCKGSNFQTLSNKILVFSETTECIKIWNTILLFLSLIFLQLAAAKSVCCLSLLCNPNFLEEKLHLLSEYCEKFHWCWKLWILLLLFSLKFQNARLLLFADHKYSLMFSNAFETIFLSHYFLHALFC